MEKTARRVESTLNKVLIVLKKMDEGIENWVIHLIEILENDYQL